MDVFYLNCFGQPEGPWHSGMASGNMLRWPWITHCWSHDKMMFPLGFRTVTWVPRWSEYYRQGLPKARNWN